MCDYGFARKKAASVASNMTICGTDQFMAPEIVFGEAYDEKAVSDRLESRGVVRCGRSGRVAPHPLVFVRLCVFFLRCCWMLL